MSLRTSSFGHFIRPMVGAVRNPAIIKLLVLVATSSLFVALLFGIRWSDSAMLYVGLPYLVAVALLVFGRSHRPPGLGSTYRWLLKNSLWVFLASSLVLREGFLCVLFFIPIYVVLVSLVFLGFMMFESASSGWGRTRASLLPLLLLASSLEGVVPELNFPTRFEVAATRTVQATPTQIRARLLEPMKIGVARMPLLALFPMPYRVETGSLEQGAIHRAWFRYRRWIFINNHEGMVEIEITQSNDRVIAARVLSDDTYLSNYLRAHHLILTMEPLESGDTQVSISFEFDRTLSPAWYFGPLQSLVVEAMANHLISEVVDHG
ncbi:MAG: hypothetical protein AB8B96_12130 [Lysobacterales bacterium]